MKEKNVSHARRGVEGIGISSTSPVCERSSTDGVKQRRKRKVLLLSRRNQQHNPAAEQQQQDKHTTTSEAAAPPLTSRSHAPLERPTHKISL